VSAPLKDSVVVFLVMSGDNLFQSLNWQTLQERRLRTRLIMFHKVINENITIPTQNILLQSQSTTRSSRKDSYRQIYIISFYNFFF
jgi:hypothetical protein